MIDFDKIPVPEIVDKYTFDDVKSEMLKFLSDAMPGYRFLESDPYMPLIEAFAYRELIMRARINKAVKAALLPTAQGSDLDNLVTLYGIERIKGVKPRATISISLTEILTSDTVFLKDTTVLIDSSRQYTARLVDDIIIPAGEQFGEGDIILELFSTDHKKKNWTLANPVPFTDKIEQKNDFLGGRGPESDDALRKRAILSLHRHATAGSVESYRYHALSANPAVKAVRVINGDTNGVSGPAGEIKSTGTVKIFIRGEDGANMDEVLPDVKKEFERKDIVPLTDKIIVEWSYPKEVTVTAGIEIENGYDFNTIVASIEKEIKAKFWNFGETMHLSYIYSVLHAKGVKKVELISPLSDTEVAVDKYITVILKLSHLKPDKKILGTAHE